MKFTKKIPEESGWYWMLDIGFPTPHIVWYDSLREEVWDRCDKFYLHYSMPWLRWGDEIKLPEPEIEK